MSVASIKFDSSLNCAKSQVLKFELLEMSSRKQNTPPKMIMSRIYLFILLLSMSTHLCRFIDTWDELCIVKCENVLTQSKKWPPTVIAVIFNKLSPSNTFRKLRDSKYSMSSALS